MTITVFCGSSNGKSAVYAEAAREVANWIADSGHTLVYGGGKFGLMGILADTVLQRGGTVTGVIPKSLKDREGVHGGLHKTLITEDINDRKRQMIQMGDAFVALPGGPGTLEEMADVISLIRLQDLRAPAIFYNKNGFYEPLRSQLERMVAEGFLEASDLEMVTFAPSMEELKAAVSRGARGTGSSGKAEGFLASLLGILGGTTGSSGTPGVTDTLSRASRLLGGTSQSASGEKTVKKAAVGAATGILADFIAGAITGNRTPRLSETAGTVHTEDPPKEEKKTPKFDLDLPFGTLMDNPKTKSFLEDYVPESAVKFLHNPFLANLTLRQVLLHLPGLSDERKNELVSRLEERMK